MADPFLATLGVQDPEDSKPAAAPDNLDAAIRTVYAEGADPTERKWIAGVIANRAKAAGKSLTDVVKEPGQFEVWSRPDAQKRMASLDPASPEYQALAKDLAPILRGETDPTEGATKFYAPKAQAALSKQDGRPEKAKFDDGTGVDVGNTRFFGGKGQAPDEFLAALGVDKAKAEAAAAEPTDLAGAGLVPYRGLEGKDTLTGPQTAAYTRENKGGLYDPNAPPGSERNKFYVQAGTDEKDVPAGAYYVARDGTTKRAPGGKEESSFAAGLGQGVGDVAASLSHVIPGTDDSEIKNALLQAQANYGAKYGGDFKSGAGRFTGQMVASAPLLAGGEAAAAPALAKVAVPEVAAFLTGKGGQAMAPGIARLVTRGASLATQGAATGAGAAGLTSSANEGSVGRQMLEGGIGGAILGPAAPAIEGAGAGLANKLLGRGAHVAPEVGDLARTAMDKYGIPLRTTQVQGVGDRAAAVHDSEMISRSGTGYAENNAAQRAAFTRAVTKTFGSDEEKLTPDVMQAAKTRIGKQFDQVAANTNITDGAGLSAKLKQVVSDAGQVLPDSDVTPLRKQVENITSALKGGTLSGEAYQALTRKGSPLDRATESGNPNIRAYAQDLRSVLDDALEASASKEDAAALKQARWQYKNLMTVKNLAAKAGVTGEISPTLLNGAVNTSFKNRAFQGAGDLGELAQIGQTFMKEPPNSGTAPRLKDILKGAALGGGGVADAAIAIHDPVLAAKLLGGAAAVGTLRYGSNKVVGAMNRNPAAVRRLIQNAPNPVRASSGGKVAGRIGSRIAPAAAGLIANRLISPTQ